MEGHIVPYTLMESPWSSGVLTRDTIKQVHYTIGGHDDKKKARLCIDVSSILSRARQCGLRDTKHRDMIQNVGGVNIGVRHPRG